MNNYNFDFIFFDPKWNKEQKEQYFLKKKKEKLEIYVALLVMICCLFGGILFNNDFLINIAFLVLLLVLPGQLIQFRRTYSSFRDIEENEKF